MAEVEAVDMAPKAAEVFVLDERGPALEGPMFEGVEDFVERQGEGEGGEAGEEPRPRGHQPLHQNQERSEAGGKGDEGIPRKE